MKIGFFALSGVSQKDTRTSTPDSKRPKVVQPGEGSSLLGQRGLPQEWVWKLGADHLALTRAGVVEPPLLVAKKAERLRIDLLA